MWVLKFNVLALVSNQSNMVSEFRKYDGYDSNGISSVAILIALVGLIKKVQQFLLIEALFLFVF